MSIPLLIVSIQSLVITGGEDFETKTSGVI